jgi:hypothetical protein
MEDYISPRASSLLADRSQRTRGHDLFEQSTAALLPNPSTIEGEEPVAGLILNLD